MVLLAVLYKKVKKAKFLYHIQDLQIEAARDLRLIKSERVIRSLFSLERYIMDRADLVTSISDGMIDRIRAKTDNEVALFSSWADTKTFYPLRDKEGLKEAFGLKADDKVILYSGAIGEKQGLDAILYAAKEVKDPHIKFLICGSGPYKEKLMAQAADMQLSNVLFYPLQPLEQFNKFLNLADVHLVIQKAKNDDLVMPSKLTTILAVGGLAIVTANPDSSLYRLVDKYKMGILVEAESREALSLGVKQAFNGIDRAALQSNARRYAERHLSVDRVLERYIRNILNL